MVSVSHIRITEQRAFAKPDYLRFSNTTRKTEVAILLETTFLTCLRCLYWVYTGNRKMGQKASGYLLIIL